MDDLISKQAILNLPRSIERSLYGEVVDEWVNIKDIKALPSISIDVKVVPAQPTPEPTEE